jgi:hypothetical protein
MIILDKFNLLEAELNCALKVDECLKSNTQCSCNSLQTAAIGPFNGTIHLLFGFAFHSGPSFLELFPYPFSP